MPNVGDFPWYHHGTRLYEQATAAQAIRAANLNWTVSKKEVPQAGKDQSRKSSLVLVRDDLWERNQDGILGPVRNSFVPFQNIEAFSLFDPIVEAGLALYDGAGAWAQGEWVWIVVRMRGDRDIAPNDWVARFLLFGHTHNTGYYRLAYVPVRLISGSSLIEGRSHNPPPTVTVPKIRPRRFKSPEIAAEEINRHFESLVNRFRIMTTRKLNAKQMNEYLNRIFERKNQRSLGVNLSIEELEQGRARCKQLFSDGRGNQMPGAKGTLWAAYNAVTEYVDNYQPGPSDWRRLREIWFSSMKGSALKVAAPGNF